MCEMCQQTYTFQFPLYLIRPFVVSLLRSHNVCYTTLPLLPPSREERCITTHTAIIIMAVRQTRSWPVGRTLCKPPCYTSYTLSFVPHKKLNLTLPHTFQLCPWLPPRPAPTSVWMSPLQSQRLSPITVRKKNGGRFQVSELFFHNTCSWSVLFYFSSVISLYCVLLQNCTAFGILQAVFGKIKL